MDFKFGKWLKIERESERMLRYRNRERHCMWQRQRKSMHVCMESKDFMETDMPLIPMQQHIHTGMCECMHTTTKPINPTSYPYTYNDDFPLLHKVFLKDCLTFGSVCWMPAISTIWASIRQNTRCLWIVFLSQSRLLNKLDISVNNIWRPPQSTFFFLHVHTHTHNQTYREID